MFSGELDSRFPDATFSLAPLLIKTPWQALPDQLRPGEDWKDLGAVLPAEVINRLPPGKKVDLLPVSP